MTATRTAPDALLIPLAEYQEPPMPADEYARRLLGRILSIIVRNDAKPFISDDQLKRVTLATLDDVVAPPACGPAIAELNRTVRGWLAERGSGGAIKTIVVPPCEETGVVQSWADRFGHQTLTPPPLDALIEPTPLGLPSLEGEGLLVVPRLEQWFLRHRNGLRPVRALLAALDTCGRPVVLGCNSWAWRFLAKAVAADQLLPDAVTVRAFDETRLHGWFSELAAAETTATVQFRHSVSGNDVLELGEGGTPKDDYLRKLAGRSLGIPWVAWNMWRRALRSKKADDLGEDAAAVGRGDSEGPPGEQTLWIAALDELVLPGVHEEEALLVMQALLIHGALSAAQLRLVLPIVGESNIVPVLIKSGFLRRTGDRFSCSPAAYPAIRAGLELAGLPLDRV